MALMSRWALKISFNRKKFNLNNNNTMEDLVSRLRAFIESEMRSCSMDFAGITPEYVQRMWGGSVSQEEIASALEKAKALIK